MVTNAYLIVKKEPDAMRRRRRLYLKLITAFLSLAVLTSGAVLSVVFSGIQPRVSFGLLLWLAVSFLVVLFSQEVSQALSRHAEDEDRQLAEVHDQPPWLSWRRIPPPVQKALLASTAILCSLLYIGVMFGGAFFVGYKLVPINQYLGVFAAWFWVMLWLIPMSISMMRDNDDPQAYFHEIPPWV